MPSRITQRKGDLALSQAICSFTKKEWDVSIPITESAPYDLVVDTGLFIKRVQVKYDGSKDGSVDLRSVWHNSKGYQVSKPKQNSFDWLYIYRPNGEEFLVKADRFSGKSTISPLKGEIFNQALVAERQTH